MFNLTCRLNVSLTMIPILVSVGVVGVAVLLKYLLTPSNPWETDRRSIQLLNKLGEGSFGAVYKGLWNNKTLVAVKTLKHGSMNPQDFLKEAQIMTTMCHPNLVKLLAVCTTKEPIYIITELMDGSLLDHLKNDRGRRICLSDQIKMAAQVASGMAYLELKNYLHRDLAARNVLVAKNNICKVADFGLARVVNATPTSFNQTDVYYIPVGNALFPLRWTAPEAIASEKFTIKGDVWSFGILLYEIITFGDMPYAEMNNHQVKEMVANGYRMACPRGCPRGMYLIMMDCWKANKHGRPSFETLHKSLVNFKQF
ncbi:tyrosine-protein kinase FRK isoform X1 [Esox lucius]|nr:tyrosine-protein kinase FRK isoform X1 [Esox lucius]